jgi:hypothetical protein
LLAVGSNGKTTLGPREQKWLTVSLVPIAGVCGAVLNVSLLCKQVISSAFEGRPADQLTSYNINITGIFSNNSNKVIAVIIKRETLQDYPNFTSYRTRMFY